MPISYRPPGAGLFGLSTFLFLAVVSAHAAPTAATPPTNTPPVSTPPPGKVTRPKTKAPRVLSNLTLDYADATQDSTQVLNSRVSVTLKDATLPAALDALMNASDKTCRIECRQLRPSPLPLDVKDVPIAGVLDGLAKLSGGRLYVLPSKLILAPETALTDEEKKHAKLYGVLLTAATLPDTPEAKALLKPNAQGKTILDIANTKVGTAGGAELVFFLQGLFSPGPVPFGTFEPQILGPISQSDLETHLQVNFNGTDYADALASFAHSVGCELYLTPEHFLICAPDQLSNPANSQWTQGAVPAFNGSSTNIRFSDPSAKAS